MQNLMLLTVNKIISLVHTLLVNYGVFAGLKFANYEKVMELMPD